MNTIAYTTSMRGTAYETDDHTVHVIITAELYRQIHKALTFLNGSEGFTSVAISDYPDRVYVGFVEDDKEQETPARNHDERVAYSELIVEKDGELYWEYAIKHVDGCRWQAWGLSVADLEQHFERK